MSSEHSCADISAFSESRRKSSKVVGIPKLYWIYHNGYPSPLGIGRSFVTFSSLRASSPLGGVARSHARGDATARGGERKLSLSSALEAACSRVPSLLALLAITEQLACRVFFWENCNALRWGRAVQRKIHPRTTPLFMPSLYLYCMSFNLVGRRA